MPNFSSGSEIGEQLQILHMLSQELLDKQPDIKKMWIFCFVAISTKSNKVYKNTYFNLQTFPSESTTILLNMWKISSLGWWIVSTTVRLEAAKVLR